MQRDAKVSNRCENKWYVVHRMVGFLKLQIKFSDGHMSPVYIKEAVHMCLFMTGKVIAAPGESRQSMENYVFSHAAYCF